MQSRNERHLEASVLAVWAGVFALVVACVAAPVGPQAAASQQPPAPARTAGVGALLPRPTTVARQTPTALATAIPTEPPAPTPRQTHKPVPKATPRPTATPVTGVFGNPWGYNFKPGRLIYNPPADFCAYFDCIASFWVSTNGYVVQCSDLTFSHSGGRSGVCSHHGGYYRTLYSH